MIRGAIDTSERSAEDLDRSMGHLEPGWYHATVIDVVEDERSSIVLHFNVNGVELREFLNDPNAATDARAGKKLADRRGMVAIRLGLVPRSLPKGQVYEFDWCAAIGQKVVLQLEWGQPSSKDGKIYARMTWAGLFPPDDERVPAELRGGKVTHLPAATPATAAAPATRATATTTAPPNNGRTRPTKAAQRTLDLDDL